MFRTIRICRSKHTVVIGGLFLLLMAPPAFGSTITVTNTNDSGPGSLRDAEIDGIAGCGGCDRVT